MSLVDDAPVSQKSVLCILIYLLLLCFFLGYCLVTFWPNPSPLTVSEIQPNHGHASDSVTIVGSGFTQATKISFDDVPATINKIDNTSATLKVPKHDAGFARVTVDDSNGQAIAIPDGFMFTPADVVSAQAGASTTESATSSSKSTPSERPTRTSRPSSSSANRNQGSTSGSSSQQPSVTGNSDLDASAGLENKSVNNPGAEDVQPVKQFEYSWLQSSNLSRVHFFHYLWLNQSIRTLITIMVIGALGSLIHVFRSFYWYVGNRTLKNSWLLMYILLPFNGAGLAVLFYLIIRGGISSQAPSNPSSFDGYAAIAALVGMFSQEAILKLQQIAGAFFTPPEQGKDPAIPVPRILSMSPLAGPAAGGTPVTVTGTGFATGNSVTFGGVAATAVNVAKSTQLTATTPAHAVGVVDVEVSNTAGEKSSLPGSFTFQ